MFLVMNLSILLSLMYFGSYALAINQIRRESSHDDSKNVKKDFTCQIQLMQVVERLDGLESVAQAKTSHSPVLRNLHSRTADCLIHCPLTYTSGRRQTLLEHYKPSGLVRLPFKAQIPRPSYKYFRLGTTVVQPKREAGARIWLKDPG